MEETQTTQTATVDPVKALAHELIRELAGSTEDITKMLGCREFYPLDPNSFGFEHLGGVAFKYDAEKAKNESNLCRIFAMPDGTRRMVWYEIKYETIGDEQFMDSIRELERADKVYPEDMEDEWWKHTGCYVSGPAVPGVDATPLFPLGQVVATRNAVDTFARLEMMICLHRHHRGDWGDICPSDRKSNYGALDEKYPCRVMSVYKVDEERTLWIITEWDRSVTTLLLPEDY